MTERDRALHRMKLEIKKLNRGRNRLLETVLTGKAHAEEITKKIRIIDKTILDIKKKRETYLKYRRREENDELDDELIDWLCS